MSGTILPLWYAMGQPDPFNHPLGLTLLAEWKGCNDGLVAHAFFKGSPNFALSVFAFAVEGWLFYSAVNSVTPQIVLNLGFENTSWKISIRQLAFNLTTLFFSIPLMYVLHMRHTKEARS
jgi:hypothetical protein